MSLCLRALGEELRVLTLGAETLRTLGPVIILLPSSESLERRGLGDWAGLLAAEALEVLHALPPAWVKRDSSPSRLPLELTEPVLTLPLSQASTSVGAPPSQSSLLASCSSLALNRAPLPPARGLSSRLALLDGRLGFAGEPLAGLAELLLDLCLGFRPAEGQGRLS